MTIDRDESGSHGWVRPSTRQSLPTPRGMVFPVGSFGHTGFTGTSLWMDPGSDTYVILFANSIQVRGSPPMTHLQGAVATATADALSLYTDASPATTSTRAGR